jgi:energy-coupling factor transport system permease protein
MSDLVTAPAWRWRVVEIVTTAVIGVAGGLWLWGLAAVWAGLTTPLGFYPPAAALLGGLWLIPGVLAALVVRRPGAAVFAELVAAVMEAVLGNTWGASVVPYGLLEGQGTELGLLIFLYRRFGALPAALAGAGAGVAEGLLDNAYFYPDWPAGDRLAYLVLATLSGAVIAGLGSWLLTDRLAATGALAPLASGRVAERV